MKKKEFFSIYLVCISMWSRRFFSFLNRSANRVDDWDASYSNLSYYTSTPKKVIITSSRWNSKILVIYRAVYFRD